MAAVCFMVTMGLYLVATVSYLAYLLHRSEALTKISLGITAAGFVFHTTALMAQMVMSTAPSPPSFHEALSFFSWMLVLSFWWWNSAIVSMSSGPLWFPWHCYRSYPRPRCLKPFLLCSPCLRPCGFM